MTDVIILDDNELSIIKYIEEFGTDILQEVRE